MKFYRFQDGFYYDNATATVDRIEFDLVRETPCGYWIQSLRGWGEERWVSKTARKRYAYPSEKEALTSYIQRKRRQIGLLAHQLQASDVRWRKALELAGEKIPAPRDAWKSHLDLENSL